MKAAAQEAELQNEDITRVEGHVLETIVQTAFRPLRVCCMLALIGLFHLEVLTSRWDPMQLWFSLFWLSLCWSQETLHERLRPVGLRCT